MFSDFSSDVFIAWAAAWLDTEGCISITYNSCSKGMRYRRHQLKIGIVQADTRPLKMLQKAYGGNIVLKKRFPNPCWSLTLHSRQAKNMLVSILPYLVVKKEAASLAIQFQELVSKNAGKIYTTEKDWDKRNWFRSKVNRTLRGQVLLPKRI